MLKKYPALSWTTIAGVVTAGLAVWGTANAGGSTNWALVITGIVPIVAGALTHAQVVPVDRVKTAIAVADSWADVGKDLARKVDVAITERPTDTP
jgi:hypothetical protein